MPVVHLTDSNIRSVKPPATAKKIDYRDDLVTGLVLRVYRSGVRVWFFVYKRHGRNRDYRLGALSSVLGLAAARQRAKEERAKVDLGGDPQSDRLAERQRARGTVAAVCTLFLDEEGKNLSERTLEEWRRIVDVEIAPTPLGKRPAPELTRGEVLEWSGRIKKRSGHVAAHAFAVLRRVYSWAVSKDRLPGSPFVGLQPPAHPPSDSRVLSPRELRALVLSPRELRALVLALGDVRRRRRPPLGPKRPGPPTDEELRGVYPDVVRLILLTLSRASMVTGMMRDEVEDVDTMMPRWVVPPRPGLKRRGRAGGTPHIVPLVPQALKIVRRRLEAIGPQGRALFPTLQLEGKRTSHETTSITDAFMNRLREAMDIRYAADELRLDVDAKDSRAAAEARDRAALALFKGRVERRPRWKIHDLRTTAATQLREYLDVDAEIVSLLLAHTKPVRKGAAEVTRIYDRSELLGPRRAALVAWASWLEALASGAAAAGLPAKVIPMNGGR